MKRKRAEEYIEKNVYDAAECVDKDGCGWAVVKRSDAYRIVELAEEDMAEKAIKAYIQCCEWREGEDSCVAGYKCDKCPSMDNFKQKLME